MKAAVTRLDPGFEFANGHELDDAAVRQTPATMIGRRGLLSQKIGRADIGVLGRSRIGVSSVDDCRKRQTATAAPAEGNLVREVRDRTLALHWPAIHAPIPETSNNGALDAAAP